MSYMPDEVYYVFVNFKIGDYDASPLPPRHVQSLSLERTDGDTTCFAKGQMSVYDETALKIEYELAKKGQKGCEFSFGYAGLGNPKSPVFKMTVANWTTQFKNDGSMTLNIEFTSDAAPSSAKPKADKYENMPIEEIVKKIAKEEGWKIRADSIEPIQPVYENDPNVTGVTGPNNTKEKRLKSFTRSMQAAPQFIRQVLAPECRAQKDGESGYALFFSDCDGKDVAEIDVPSSAENNESGGGGFIGQVVNFINKIASFIGEFFSLGSEVNALQKLNGNSVLTEKTDIGSIGGDVGAVLEIANVISSQINEHNFGKYTDTPSTNATVYFRPRARLGRHSFNTNQQAEAKAAISSANPTSNQTKQAQASGNAAWRAELTKGIDSYYCFELGTGNTPRATVISFTPTYNGTILWGSGGENVKANAVDANKNTAMKGSSNQTAEDAKKSTNGTSRMLQASSASREELENMAAYLHKAAKVRGESASMEIFGDPTIQLTKDISILMLTKYGQPHFTSGKWKITGIRDNIQGGTYTTTLTLSPSTGNTENAAEGTNKAEKESGGATHPIAADASVQKAIDWAVKIANDDSHGYSQASREGPDYDCSSFVYNAFEEAGFGVIKNCTSWPGHPGNCETMPGDFKAAGFEMLPFDKDNLKVGDILWHGEHTEIYLGDGKKVGAHGVENRAQKDQISVNDMYYTDWTHIFRYPTKTPNPQNATASGQGKIFEVSAYTPDGGTMNGGDTTAYGVSVVGKTINSHYMAVNPNTIPYGTICNLTFSEPYTHLSGEWVAVDTGGYFNTHPNAIDLMFGNGRIESIHKSALEFGRREVTLVITDKKLSAAEAEHWKE